MKKRLRAPIKYPKDLLKQVQSSHISMWSMSSPLRQTKIQIPITQFSSKISMTAALRSSHNFISQNLAQSWPCLATKSKSHTTKDLAIWARVCLNSWEQIMWPHLKVAQSKIHRTKIQRYTTITFIISWLWDSHLRTTIAILKVLRRTHMTLQMILLTRMSTKLSTRVMKTQWALCPTWKRRPIKNNRKEWSTNN